MMSELCHQYQRLFICQFSNLYLAKIRICSATFTVLWHFNFWICGRELLYSWLYIT